MKSFCSVLLICLVSAVAVNAKMRRTASSSKKSTVVKAFTQKRSAAKRKPGKRDQKANRSAPRQSEPTPERYMQIQQALADKGYYSGPVDGVWSSDSLEALKKFQSDQNLSPDGKLGSLSLIALGLGPKRDPLAQLSTKPESNP